MKELIEEYLKNHLEIQVEKEYAGVAGLDDVRVTITLTLSGDTISEDTVTLRDC